MKRQFNHTNSATTAARKTNAANGGVEVAGKVYRGDGIDINDFPHFMRSQESLPDCTNVPVTKGFVTAHEKRHETPEVRNCREIVTGRIVTEFELREG